MGCFGYICKGCGTSIRGDCFAGGELCTMIHVRHGKEMGRVEGHYDEYGRVIEQEGLDEDLRFRGDGSGINSHKEICFSEFNLNDSYYKSSEKRVYMGEEVDFRRYMEIAIERDLKKCDYNITKLPYYGWINSLRNKDAVVGLLLEKCKEYYSEYVVPTITSISKDKLKQFIIFTMKTIVQDNLYIYFWEEKNKYFGYNFRRLKEVTRESFSGIVAYHSICYRKAIKDGTFNLIPSELDPNQSWGNVRKKFK